MSQKSFWWYDRYSFLVPDGEALTEMLRERMPPKFHSLNASIASVVRDCTPHPSPLTAVTDVPLFSASIPVQILTYEHACPPTAT